MNREKVAALIEELLREIGEDPTREGLLETPRRVAKFWDEFINYDAGKITTCFESIKTDQLIMLSGIRVYSLCEHHLLPFWCDISIGYLADTKVIGISKIARIAQKHAHKLQLQERLVDQIAEEMREITGSENIAVIGSGVHTCMTMRGIRINGTMTSSSMHGEFRENDALRAEFLSLSKQQ
ncbi:MAG: GTP cyclohydrolase I [Methylovulum sp.]